MYVCVYIIYIYCILYMCRWMQCCSLSEAAYRDPRGLVSEVRFNIGALIIRIGFWGPLYYIYNAAPPKLVQVIIEVFILGLLGWSPHFGLPETSSVLGLK